MEASSEQRAALLKPLRLQHVLKHSLVIFTKYMEWLRSHLLRHYKNRYGLEALNNPCNYVGIHAAFDRFFASLAGNTNTNSAWALEPLRKSTKGALPAPGSTAADNSTVIADTVASLESAQSKEHPKKTRYLSPERAVRPTPPRWSKRTRSNSKLSPSQTQLPVFKTPEDKEVGTITGVICHQIWMRYTPWIVQPSRTSSSEFATPFHAFSYHGKWKRYTCTYNSYTIAYECSRGVRSNEFGWKDPLVCNKEVYASIMIHHPRLSLGLRKRNSKATSQPLQCPPKRRQRLWRKLLETKKAASQEKKSRYVL